MKTKVHLRVGYDKRRRTSTVVANVRPNNTPLMSPSGDHMPTVAFAVVLDIADSLFAQAERVIAELTVSEPEGQIAASVRQVPE